VHLLRHVRGSPRNAGQHPYAVTLATPAVTPWWRQGRSGWRKVNAHLRPRAVLSVGRMGRVSGSGNVHRGHRRPDWQARPIITI
jgi:hypothetical protein